MSDNPQIIQRIATKALIVNTKGQVLILREASTYDEGNNIGRYGLPGGRLNPGEAFIDGLKREVREETGLEIEIVKPLYVGEWRPVIKSVPNQIIAIYFLCKPLTTNLQLSSEHDDFHWVLPKEIKLYDVMSPDNKVAEKSVSN